MVDKDSGALPEAPRHKLMGPTEFILFIAISLSVGAMGTDLMLPALRAMTEDFGLSDANLSQATIIVFLLGVGIPQLLFGPVSDRFGRRPLFLWGLAVFIVGGVLTAFARDFSSLLLARLLQGFGAGAQRVVTFSIIRDHYSGLPMARVMSLIMTGLLLEPLFAPMLGQAVLLVGSWRWIIGVVTLAGSATLVWALLRLEESLPPERRRPISARSVLAAFRMVIVNRTAITSMLAFGLLTGAHLGFLTSAQSIFQQTFDAGLKFTLLLALVSLAMSIAAFTNSRLVRRYGSTRLVRTGLCALVAINALLLLAAHAGIASLSLFLLIQAGNMFAFGLLLPNLTAMSMNPLGQVAGTASSMFGFLSTTLGALLAFVIGQLFDGTVRPMAAGYVLMSGVALLVLSLGARQQQAVRGIS